MNSTRQKKFLIVGFLSAFILTPRASEAITIVLANDSDAGSECQVPPPDVVQKLERVFSIVEFLGIVERAIDADTEAIKTGIVADADGLLKKQICIIRLDNVRDVAGIFLPQAIAHLFETRDLANPKGFVCAEFLLWGNGVGQC